MAHEVHVTPFEYDVEEIGELINTHYKSLGWLGERLRESSPT